MTKTPFEQEVEELRKERKSIEDDEAKEELWKYLYAKELHMELGRELTLKEGIASLSTLLNKVIEMNDEGMVIEDKYVIFSGYVQDEIRFLMEELKNEVEK